MPARSTYNSRCSLQVGCLRPWQRCSAPASRSVLKLGSTLPSAPTSAHTFLQSAASQPKVLAPLMQSHLAISPGPDGQWSQFEKSLWTLPDIVCLPAPSRLEPQAPSSRRLRPAHSSHYSWLSGASQSVTCKQISWGSGHSGSSDSLVLDWG